MFSATQRLQFERTATRPTPNTYIHAHVACIYFHSSIFPFFFMLEEARGVALRCLPVGYAAAAACPLPL